mgnify:CR=1 FL=1
MINITKAILEVMKEVTNIEKGMNVGTGNSSYKAVGDSIVRATIKESMLKNGLVIIPTGVTATTKIDRWEEESQYGKKSKQSILTEAHTTYLLMHESGESVPVAGYGQGVDSQDKGAGKATTYALKNVLLDSFLVIKGEDMDTDKTHSDDLPVPPKRTVAGRSDDDTEDAFTKTNQIPD